MAYKIDDENNLGSVFSPEDYGDANRNVVRTSGGVLYACLATPKIGDYFRVRMYKSTDGGETWVAQDTDDEPQYASFSSRAIAITIDSNDVIHVLYRWLVSDLSYRTFSGDQWSAAEGVYSQDQGTYKKHLAIAVDSGNKPHIAFVDATKKKGTNYETIYYTNRIAGSWKEEIEVDGASNEAYCCYPDITISDEDIPEISYSYSKTVSNVKAAQGNQTDAESFTIGTVETFDLSPGTFVRTSIAVDTSGNTYVAYGDPPNIDLAYMLDGNAFSGPWTKKMTGSAGQKPSIAIDGTDIYIFYEDDNDDICYDKYSEGSFAGEVQLQAGTFEYVRAKWAYLNNNEGAIQIDYIFSDGIDLYWDKLSLVVPPVTKPTAQIINA